MTPVIRINGLAIGYDRVLVSGLDWSLDPGLYRLRGGNGVGKTTFLRTCAGLLAPHAGSVVIDGITAHGHRDRVARRIGWLGDRLEAPPGLRVGDVLALTAWSRGLPGSVLSSERCRAWVDPGWFTRPLAELSMGQSRRVGLAMALLADLPVLMLDEPDHGLDAGARERLRATLSARRRDTVCVVVTHDESLLDGLAASDLAW